MVLRCSNSKEAIMANIRKKDSSSKKSPSSIRVEFDAMGYLSKFPPEVALVVARKVERMLAISWEAEQEEMIRRGDPRKVLCMTDGDKRDLDDAVARVPPDIQSNAAAEEHVIRLLANLSPDEAWWVAHLVADFEEAKFANSKLSSTECRPDQNMGGAKLDPVSRAMALAESFYGAAEK
jgi:hypothetical protein